MRVGDSSEEFDRGEKLALYKTLPSLQAIVLVEKNARHIETWLRAADGEWSPTEATAAQQIELNPIQAHLNVTTIYDRAGAK